MNFLQQQKLLFKKSLKLKSFINQTNFIKNFSTNKFNLNLATNSENSQKKISVTKIGEQIEKQTNLKDIFAVVQMGGKQYKITPNDLISVERILADVGSSILLNKILLVGGKDFTAIGRPMVSNVTVLATVEQQRKAEKVIVFKKHKRKRYRRWKGHQQLITVLRIEDIQFEKPKIEKSRVVSVE